MHPGKTGPRPVQPDDSENLPRGPGQVPTQPRGSFETVGLEFRLMLFAGR
jgi:hypothetical protein